MEEVLCDEKFIDWSAGGSRESSGAQYVQGLVDNDPAQKKLILEAQAFMKAIQLPEIVIAQANMLESADRLKLALEKPENNRVNGGVLRTLYRWSSVAAVFLLVMAAVFFWNQQFANERIITGFSERNEKHLLDGSTVFLNSNSSVTMAPNFKNSKEREVWVNGEVYFKVAHKQDNRKFIVHADHFDIEVTGTQFNVINRNNNQSILLKEGCVKLHLADGSIITMKPGDFYEYVSAAVVKKKVKPEEVLAWMDRKIVFENTPLREAVKKINEYYGVSFHFSSDVLAEKLITGILPNDNLEGLIQAIDAIGDIQIIKENSNSYQITNPPLNQK